MLKRITSFKNLPNQKREINVLISDLNDGINVFDDYIINKVKNEITYVIDRVCDHNGGKLIPKGDFAICPMHGWTLDLQNLKYLKSNNCKHSIEFGVNNGLLVFNLDSNIISSDKSFISINKDVDVEVNFLSHACVEIKALGYSIITDPWLLGPAFMTGWWLLTPPKEIAFATVPESASRTQTNEDR
jgi:CMP-N-acetylneuraminate monooxygenase